jgi:hypothetical protein
VFINHGLLEVQRGELEFEGVGVEAEAGMTSDGTIRIMPDAELVLLTPATLLPGATVNGGGTLLLADTLSTPPGPQLITANVIVDGSFVVGGHTGIGSVTINGTYTQRADFLEGLFLNVGGSSACTAFDHLVVTGRAVLNEVSPDSFLTVSRLDGCNPSPGQRFTILQAAPVVGTFTDVEGVAPEFALSYTPTSVVLTGT